MSLEPWNINEPLAGENDPLGREDTANRYLRGLYSLFRAGHKEDGQTQSIVYNGFAFSEMETGTYPGNSGSQTVTLSNSNLVIKALETFPENAEAPVLTDDVMIGPVPTSIALDYDTTQSDALCMAEYGGNLYVGSGTSGNVYKYDTGTLTWSLSYASAADYITALAVSGTNLYAAGYADGPPVVGNVFKYDGSTWSTVKTDADKHTALKRYSAWLFLGTTLSSTGGAGIYQYNGSTWSLVWQTTPGYATTVTCFTYHNNTLFAGTGPYNMILYRGATSWYSIYSGYGYDSIEESLYDTTQSDVTCFAIYQGKTYAGTQLSGNIYVFNRGDLSWSLSHSTGLDAVTSLRVYGTKLYAAGYSEGAPPTGKVEVFDGTTWSTSLTSTNRHHCLEVSSGNLYMGISEYVSGAASVAKVLKFDGSSWSTSFSSPIIDPAAVYIPGYDWNLYDTGILSLLDWSGTLFAGGAHIYRKPPVGDTWEVAGKQSVNEYAKPIDSLGRTNSSLYYASSSGGINSMLNPLSGTQGAFFSVYGPFDVIKILSYDNAQTQHIYVKKTDGKIYIEYIESTNYARTVLSRSLVGVNAIIWDGTRWLYGMDTGEIYGRDFLQVTVVGMASALLNGLPVLYFMLRGDTYPTLGGLGKWDGMTVSDGTLFNGTSPNPMYSYNGLTWFAANNALYTINSIGNVALAVTLAGVDDIHDFLRFDNHWYIATGGSSGGKIYSDSDFFQSKQIGTGTFVEAVVDIGTKGEFTLNSSAKVNAAGVTYHYIVYGENSYV
jgi:hypothetical protein